MNPAYTPLTDADLRILTDFSGQRTLGGVCRQAAAEIRALRASEARLLAALTLFANVANDSGLKADVLGGMRKHEAVTMERALAEAAACVAAAEGRDV